jgi:magnesium chelatase family protein
MVGPPGSGKSMLAQRFAGLLPPMTVEEALQSAAVASVGGRFVLERWATRPTCAPHHTASAVAMVGGGSPPRPGEISLAHHGVLFLDELPEFPGRRSRRCASRWKPAASPSPGRRGGGIPGALSAGRGDEPLPLRLPGLAADRLPLLAGAGGAYQSKLSGPLIDRIDLQVEVPALPPHELLAAPPGRSHAAIRERSTAARLRAMARQGKSNQALEGPLEIDDHLLLHDAAASFLNTAAARLGWSARSGGPAGCQAMKPRLALKFFRFGNTVFRLVSLTPNHLPMVAPIWSTDTPGRKLPEPTSSLWFRPTCGKRP